MISPPKIKNKEILRTVGVPDERLAVQGDKVNHVDEVSCQNSDDRSNLVEN